MGEILELAEALWNGELDTYTYHPFGRPRGMEILADGVWFHKGFSNTVIRETADGLIIVDPAAAWDARTKYEEVRKVTKQRLNVAVYTHGHNDHTFGVREYIQEARERGNPMPRVYAHEAIWDRIARYRETLQWNALINLRQFRGGKGHPQMEADVYLPDCTFTHKLDLTVGGVQAHLRHAHGETDDAVWVFFPEDGLLCTGDLFIWALPNAGNPQKVQRYAKEWALALREMASLEPRILAPGHGMPIVGTERVIQALTDTAQALECLHDQTLRMMNQGEALDSIIHKVKVPDSLLNKPYLRPVYDDPEFIVRNIYRLYGGWYDGIPSHLKPAAEERIAREVARLAGGADTLAKRAEELLEHGDGRLAGHLAYWAWMVDPENSSIRDVAARVYLRRALNEPSTMAVGIFLDAVRCMGVDPQEVMPGKTVIHAQVQRAQRKE